MDKKVYHGMTLDEIRDKYYIFYDEYATTGCLKTMNSKLAKLWQDVSYYKSDTERICGRLENQIQSINEQLKHNMEIVRQKYIIQNMTMAKDRKLSDKARDTYAYIEAIDDNVRQKLDYLRQQLVDVKEELAIWDRILGNFKYIAGRIDTSTIDIGIEAKIDNPNKMKREDYYNDDKYNAELEDIINSTHKVGNVK